MVQTRRQLLATLGITGGGALGGCLRLTEDGEGPSQSDTAASDGTGSDTATESPTEEATTLCTAETQPPTGSERFTHPFGDSRNSFAVPQREAPAEQPCLAWTQPLSVTLSRDISGPVVTGGHVVSYQNELLQARARTDGTVAWDGSDTPAGTLDQLKPIGMPGGDLLVYGQNRRTDDLVLVAVDDAGNMVRSEVVYSASSPMDARAEAGRVVDDRVYIGIGDLANEETRVLAYDWPNGTVLWDESLGGIDLTLRNMGADGDTVVVSKRMSEGENNVWALASDDGSVQWSKRLPIGRGAIPVLDGTNVYLPVEGYNSESLTNQVRALSKATGDVEWMFEARNPPRTGVSVDGERVYLVADDELYAIDPETGTPEWRFSPDNGAGILGNSDSLPIVCRDTLLLGSQSAGETPARVRALNKATGELRWSFDVGGNRVQSPIPADGALYTVVDGGSDGDTPPALYSFY